MPTTEDGEHTRYFVIIRSLGPRAATLHHLLASLLHDPIEVREVLQRTCGTIYNTPHTEQVLYDRGARHFYRASFTMENERINK